MHLILLYALMVVGLVETRSGPSEGDAGRSADDTVAMLQGSFEASKRASHGVAQPDDTDENSGVTFSMKRTLVEHEDGASILSKMKADGCNSHDAMGPDDCKWDTRKMPTNITIAVSLPRALGAGSKLRMSVRAEPKGMMLMLPIAGKLKKGFELECELCGAQTCAVVKGLEDAEKKAREPSFAEQMLKNYYKPPPGHLCDKKTFTLDMMDMFSTSDENRMELLEMCEMDMDVTMALERADGKAASKIGTKIVIGEDDDGFYIQKPSNPPISKST